MEQRPSKAWVTGSTPVGRTNFIINITMKLSDLFENTSPLSPFDRTTTDLPTYDQALKLPDYFRDEKGITFEIVEMTPDQYIQKCADGFGSSVEKTISSRDPEKVNLYAQQMSQGQKFPMLLLNYVNSRFRNQEGIHRAMAAKKLGVQQVPVMITQEER